LIVLSLAQAAVPGLVSGEHEPNSLIYRVSGTVTDASTCIESNDRPRLGDQRSQRIVRNVSVEGRGGRAKVANERARTTFERLPPILEHPYLVQLEVASQINIVVKDLVSTANDTDAGYWVAEFRLAIRRYIDPVESCEPRNLSPRLAQNPRKRPERKRLDSGLRIHNFLKKLATKSKPAIVRSRSVKFALPGNITMRLPTFSDPIL